MNRRAVYKILSFAITPILCTALFIVPVKAEMDIYYPDPNSYSAYNYFFIHGYNHLVLSSTDNITYNVSLDNVGSESGSEHTTGTINSNGSSTLGAKYMTCSTNTGTSASQTYSCYFSNRSSGVSNSQSINIGFNENTYTSVNNSINTDITGTITSSSSSKTYTYLPWLNGTFSHYNSYNSNDFIMINKDLEVLIAFYTKSYLNMHSVIYPLEGSTDNYTIRNDTLKYGANFFLNVVSVKFNGNGNQYITIDIPQITNHDILPIYYGYSSFLPDNISLLLARETRTNSILLNGDNNTSSIADNADNANNTVNEKIHSFDQIESNQVNDMESKISNINVQSDLMSNNNFLSSAQWVKTQFDRMTVSTPIGSVLSFSLILGLALIFLGKIR